MEKVISITGEPMAGTVDTKRVREHSCGDCHYADFERDTSDNGRCLRYPPTVLLTPQQNPLNRQMMMTLQSFHVPVARDGWCGEHLWG
jgi:hypothetical protein